MTAEQAAVLCKEIPAFVTSVALFMDADAEQVSRIIGIMRPGLLQFHGRETPDFCRSFGLPYIKSVPMGSNVDPLEWAMAHPEALGMLLDSNAIGEAGGSGETFDAHNIELPAGANWILAGGLNPDNVAGLIKQMQPYAVDVSSGVENAPGVKCNDLMRAFTAAVRQADRN